MNEDQQRARYTEELQRTHDRLIAAVARAHKEDKQRHQELLQTIAAEMAELANKLRPGAAGEGA